MQMQKLEKNYYLSKYELLLFFYLLFLILLISEDEMHKYINT